MRDIRIALVTMTSSLGCIEENIGRMLLLADQAGQNGAEIVCFPELSVTGYASNLSGPESALYSDGREIKRIKAFVEKSGTAVLAGFAEKDNKDRTYATHTVILPGKKPAFYRKLHIAPPEKKSFSSGESIPVFKSGDFKFGIQLCYDAHFPELSILMAEKGVDAIFIPHASPRKTPEEKLDSWMRHLPARAYDNGLYILACNQNGENGNGLSFPGLSLVIDPAGCVVEKDISGKDGILYADLEKSAIDSVRKHPMRYFFPNRIRLREKEAGSR